MLLRRPRVAAAAPTTPRVVSSPDARARMLRVAAEAVVLQDRAVEVIDRIRRHAPLGDTAPEAGPLSRRFFSLGDELAGTVQDPRDEELRTALVAVLHHHATLLSLALELSAYEWRSPRLWDQVEALDGLGRPGQRLEHLYTELAATG